ncbi:MAG: family 2 glycosyl transferase, partial [Clostridium sp.]
IIKEQVISDTKDLIDVIHGNANLEKKAGHAGGRYEYDVSPYVIGWILGIEWDPQFVLNTIDINKDKTSFNGEYLYTENATSFESFLCELADEAIKYETEKYNMQRPLSFTNWVTTDMLSHPNEPSKEEDMVTVNTESVKYNSSFKPGLFASYHIYPYYPDTMNYQNDYVSYINENGNVNTYEAYLKDLIKEHTVPVLVGEFGVPSSRGMTHRNIHTGFNQGKLDEKTQGEMNSSMLKDIYDNGYAGGLVFTWQDEWFKRTWNNMDLDIPDRRAYWSNPQTNEQEFGLLAFDPGNEKSIVYVDGEKSDWKNKKLISENDNLSMFVKSDEKYLYIMMESKEFDFENNRIMLPIDVTPNSGSKTFDGVNFQRDADFIIDINGKENSRILVHSYYDSFYYMYAKQLKMIEENKSYESADSEIFNPMYLCLNRELKLPEDNKIIPFEKYETGKLHYGNGNPNSDDYNSLSDFNFTNDVLEIRIPWQLLNVMDPSSKMIMDDLYKVGIKPIEVDNIYIGASWVGNNSNLSLEMNSFTWGKWNMPVYHERLKPSYYEMQKTLRDIDNKFNERKEE